MFATGLDGLRLLHVHAHPDDESSKGAATTAKYVAEGVRVMVAVFTGGERGSILNTAMDHPGMREKLPEIRRVELHRASEILGFDYELLGFTDSGFPEDDPPTPLPEGCFALTPLADAVVPLVRLIRDFRPQVMTTYDETGGYPHPDHIYTHVASMEAFRLASQPSYRPDLGESWQINKVYYQMCFHFERFNAINEELKARGIAADLDDWLDIFRERRIEGRITTSVECGEYFKLRDDALRAHSSQISPDDFWFAAPLDVQQDVWPTEDYQIIFTNVPVTLPENDLFAGLR